MKLSGLKSKTSGFRMAPFIVLIMLTLILFSFTSALYFRPASGESINPWGSTTSYPTSITSPSCAIYQSYIYCVAGATSGGGVATNAVYYATISSSGVGTWISTTNYPANLYAPSCAIYSGYIYCVGGNANSGTQETNAVYFASVSSSGVGTWTSTTSLSNHDILPIMRYIFGLHILCWRGQYRV